MEEDYKTTDLGSSNEQYRGVPYQPEYMTQPINPFASSQPFSTEWNRKFTRSALEAKQDEEQSKIGTLITQGYLPEIYKDMTLPPAMLNDLWNNDEIIVYYNSDKELYEDYNRIISEIESKKEFIKVNEFQRFSIFYS